MRRAVVIISSAALFCAGGVCGWLLRGDGRGTGDVSVPPDKTVDSRPASNERGVRSSDKSDVAEPQFDEAIPAEEFRRRQGPAEAAARSVGVENAEDLKRFRETILSIFEATREQEHGFRRR